MNILVVDDEKVIREGVKRTIQQAFTHMQVYTAGSAEEALDVFRNESIQLVFLDIMMPGVSGLELMSAMRKTHHAIKWVVISAYSDFKFAQEALRLGALDYILKPIGKEKLREVISTIEYELESVKAKASDTGILDHHLKYMREAVFQRWIHGLDIGRYDISKLQKSFTSFHLIFVRIGSKVQELNVKHFIIENVLTELVETRGHGFVASFDRNSLLGVVAVQEGVTIRQFEEEIREHLGKYLKVPYELLTSPLLWDFEAIPSEVRKFQQGEVSSINYLSMGKNEDMIDIAVQYIKNNFQENLSLEKVASVVYLNPIYFSQLFKQKTGIGYKDYVIQLRLEQAKRLLANPNLKITDVAGQIGYHDIRHFTQVFRKKYQITPSQFRSML
ncbi:response regulator [Paenibacillus sp. N1-5-1-14]|uniref:response regulator n=1 Tax=Paenibacillus radicibacter TaxID=2972488 RepID=UPI002158EFD3|nr:response regulator [Paenibacillus radicibacter]MCR8645172.1 response regulator [Paenibacillus radicibacter]